MSLAVDLPIFYSISCFLLAFLYAYYLYKKEKIIKNKLLLRILFLLRFIVIFLISFLLLNPLIKSFEENTENPVVIIAQDISSSIKEKTSQFLIRISEEFPEFDVYAFSFSSDVELGFSEINNGTSTNFYKLFNEIKARFVNRNISAFIIATDGLYNEGENLLYHNIPYPVYPIALGDTNVKKDVKILRIQKNDIAFLGNRFPVEVSISMQEAINENITLSLLNDSQKLFSKQLTVRDNDDYRKIKILIEASDVGLQKYDVQLSSLIGEENIRNNNYTFYVDVVESRYNILILNGVSHPDLSAYKSVLESNKNYKLDIYREDEFVIDNLDSYQLVVLFGVYDEKEKEIIKKLSSSSASLLVFQLSARDIDSELFPNIKFSMHEGIEKVAPAFNNDFTKFTLSSDFLDFISQAPPLDVFSGRYTLSDDCELVLYQKIGEYITDRPIMFFSDYNDRRIGYITAQGFWKWRIYDYLDSQTNDILDELFGKITQYLLIQEDKNRFRLDYENQIIEGDNVCFDAVLFNESFEMVTNKDIQMNITNQEGDQYRFDFSKYNNRYFLDIGVLDVGKYYFMTKVKGSSFKKEGFFEVQPIQLEQLYTVADHKLLLSLAERSGGQVFDIANIDQLVSKINSQDNYHKKIFLKEKILGLINIPWILLSLLLLIFFEWFIRKYNGLV